MFRHILVFPMCILLVACAIQSQSPPRTDPLTDLVGNVKIIDSPTRVITDAKTKSLALIVSTNSETQIKYHEEMVTKYTEGYVKVYEPKNYNAAKSLQDSVGPRKLIETVVSELLQRFKSVTVVSDLAEYKALNYDVAAVVDIGMEHKSNSSPAGHSVEYTTDVSLIFFDKKIRKIGTANGIATELWERSNFGDIGRALVEATQLVANSTARDIARGSLSESSDGGSQSEFVISQVEAQKKSRASAFRLLNTSLDQFIQK